MDVQFLLGIRCMTYNQSAYIEDTLNGFTMQQTDFPFVCCVMDDASTDGEQDIINQYLEMYFDLNDKSVVLNKETDDYVMTFARHKDNLNCFFAVFYLKYNHYGKPELKQRKLDFIRVFEDGTKYIAICEGDDYWIDPYKLQKQVDILESDPECSLVYTSYRRYVQEEKRYMEDYIVDKEGYIYENFFQSVEYDPCILTLTVCVRSEILYNLPPMPQGAFKGDTYMWIAASLKGKIRILKDVTAVYRISRKSASHFTDKVSSLKFNYELLKMKLAILNLYPIKNINNTLELKKTYLRNIVKYSLLTNNHSIYSDFQNDKKYFGEAKYRVKLFFYYLFREKHLFSCLSSIYRKFYN